MKRIGTKCAGRCVAGRAGLTLLEMAIGIVVLILLSGSILGSMDSMKRLTTRGTSTSGNQHAAERALNRIIDDLRFSGFVELADGRSFPHLVQDGKAGGAYHEDHSHEPASKLGQPDDPDAGADRGLVFVAWSDADDNGIPDIDWSAKPEPEVIWEETATISYSVRTQPDGRNALVRTIAGEETRVIARDVERVVFDTTQSAGVDEVSLGVVRVRLWFRSVGDDGTIARSRAEASVRLRNGEAVWEDDGTIFDELDDKDEAEGDVVEGDVAVEKGSGSGK